MRLRRSSTLIMFLSVLSTAGCGGRSGLDGLSPIASVGGLVAVGTEGTFTTGGSTSASSRTTGGAIASGGEVMTGGTKVTGGMTNTGGMVSTGGAGSSGGSFSTGLFACGDQTCTTYAQYCVLSTSDVEGEPDMYFCAPLPLGCLNQLYPPWCGCLASVSCGYCSNGANPGELMVVCPGG